jgi:hypothetical protein
MPTASPCRRLAIAAVSAVVAAGAQAGPAMAGAPAAGCPVAAVSNPFAPWGDDADYQLAPAGDVEDKGASWSLTGGARAVKGNETFMVSSPLDELSLRLPGEASATTDRMCIGAEHPSFRFFAKRSGGSPAGRLLVDVVFDDASGRERSLAVGSVAPSSAWAPSSALPTMVEAIAPTPDETTELSFRFTPQGGGIWSVDDVYVDPHRII